MPTDKNKNKGKKKPAKAKNPRGKSQQLSDKLARQVAKGKMTYSEARKAQRKQDSVAMSKKTVTRKTRSSSQNLPSKRRKSPAKYKLDRKGDIKRYKK